MTIPFVGTGGLFTRIGTIGQVVADIQALVQTTLPADVTAILNQYLSEPDLTALVPTQANSAKLASTALDSALQQVASQTIARMVFRDNPVSSRTSPLTNLTELIRQMLVTGDTVKRCTITASSTPVTGYTNVGSGAVVLSTKRGDGLTQENAFAEVAKLVCTGDAQQGGTAGNEIFQFTGTEAQTSPFHYEWPLGSGANASLSSTDATKNNSGNNLLTDSAWQGTWTANVPANWIDVLSLAGVDFFRDTNAFHQFGSDTSVLYFTGGTGHTPQLTQQFNSSAGTLGALKPDTVYHGAAWLKVNGIPPDGQLTFDLVDQNTALVSDDQGVVNSSSINANTLTPYYLPYTFVFRTSKQLPTNTRFRVRVSSPISGGGFNVYLAHLSFTVANPLYTGGPFGSLHSGAVNWLKNDKFNVTVGNDRGGATNQKTFQSLFDRLFSMRLNGLLLPSAASPTIPDSLI